MTIAKSSIQTNAKHSFSKTELKGVVNQVFDDLKKKFTKSDIDELAWETGFNKRSSSRIGGFDFLASILVSSIDAVHTSLERISDILLHINRKTSVTAQAIMKRINNENTVDFLKKVYSQITRNRLLNLDEIPAPLLNCFSKVLIQDSSTITLHEKLQKEFKGSGGRASSSSAKFDVIYDYKAKEYETIKLTDQSEADQKLAFRIENSLTKNSLVIRDLGYTQVKSLSQIIEKEAFFLNRLRSDMQVYLSENDEKPVDLGEYLAKKCKQGNVLDEIVFVTAQKLPVRLVAYLAPEEVINKRRRIARATAKKQGRTLRDATIKFYAFTVFITNVPKEIWKPEVIGTIYRIRWQIELIFKCWKSYVHINYLKGITPQRVKCLIYAKLIFIVLVNQIYRLAEFVELHLLRCEVSMQKVFLWMRDMGKLLKIIKGHLSGVEKGLFIEVIPRSMAKQDRKRKTTLTMVLECGNCEKKWS